MTTGLTENRTLSLLVDLLVFVVGVGCLLVAVSFPTTYCLEAGGVPQGCHTDPVAVAQAAAFGLVGLAALGYLAVTTWRS